MTHLHRPWRYTGNDPLRRLLAAIALCVIYDAQGRGYATPAEQADAWEFIASTEGEAFMAGMAGMGVAEFRRKVRGLEVREL